MAGKLKIEETIRAHAKNLDPSAEAIVLENLKKYVWNKRKCEKIEKQVDEGMSLDDEKKMLGIRHQLICENISVSGHIMRTLKGVTNDVSELDEFLK